MLRKLIECIGATVFLATMLITSMAWADRAMGAVVEPSLPSPYMLDGSTVAYLSCGEFMGTAVYLGGGKYLTAAHVVYDDGKAASCSINGKPVTILHANVTADWALIKAATYPPFHAVISCARLVEGQEYFSTGFAEGVPWPVTTRLIGESFRSDGQSYLRGSIVNGMSGGSVSDVDGVVHAINDTRSDDGIPHSGVVELADVPWLCKKG